MEMDDIRKACVTDCLCSDASYILLSSIFSLVGFLPLFVQLRPKKLKYHSVDFVISPTPDETHHHHHIFISGYQSIPERPQKPIELATIKQHKENCKNEKIQKK